MILPSTYNLIPSTHCYWSWSYYLHTKFDDASEDDKDKNNDDVNFHSIQKEVQVPMYGLICFGPTYHRTKMKT